MITQSPQRGTKRCILICFPHIQNVSINSSLLITVPFTTVESNKTYNPDLGKINILHGRKSEAQSKCAQHHV